MPFEHEWRHVELVEGFAVRPMRTAAAGIYASHPNDDLFKICINAVHNHASIRKRLELVALNVQELATVLQNVLMDCVQSNNFEKLFTRRWRIQL